MHADDEAYGNASGDRAIVIGMYNEGVDGDNMIYADKSCCRDGRLNSS